MSCYHPLKAFTVGYKPDGKKILKITGLDAHHIESRGDGKWQPVCHEDITPGWTSCFEYIEIPCGKCIGCRIDYSRQWANRCMLELQYHNEAWFVTLTYDEDHVPRSAYCIDESTGEAAEALTLCKRDLQLFFKRLRKAFPNDHIRYFCSGEYGDTSCRPHYHCIIFGLHLCDTVPDGKSDQGHQYFTSASLDRCWYAVPRSNPNLPASKIGIVKCAPVTWETCAYTARYVVKKVNGPMAEFYDEFNLEPEFAVMSRKPGIARQYFDEHKDYIYKYDQINVSTDTKGLTFRPPHYFDRLYDLDDPEASASVKEQRRIMAVALEEAKLAQTGLSRQELLEVEEAAFKDRVKLLKRR